MNQQTVQSSQFGKNGFFFRRSNLLGLKNSRISIFFLILFLLAGYCWGVAAGNERNANLIKNPGFEEKAVNHSKDKSFYQWNSYSPAGSVTHIELDNIVFHSGLYSVKACRAEKYFLSFQRLPVKPGEIYSAEYFVKTNLEPGGGSISFSIAWLNKGKWAPGRTYAKKITGKNDWKRYFIRDIVVPQDADTIQVGFCFENIKGKEEECWVDDIALEKQETLDAAVKLKPAEQQEIAGSLSFPKIWHVFGPLKREDAILAPDILKKVPQYIQLASGKKIEPRQVRVDDPFCRVDLERLLGGTEVNKTAYVFIPFTVPSDTKMTFGMGADWWMQAWLDGVMILDTTEGGNAKWPPTIHDHQKTADVASGEHVLAIRFISGSGSSILALGGPDDLRKGKPLSPLLQKDPMPEGNLVANGGFEEGPQTNPFIPAGWKNGVGHDAFQKDELTAKSNGALSGKCSLEINTMGSGPDKRKLFIPLSLDVDTCYKISFKAHAIEGDGYVTVSVREDMNSGYNTPFIRAIGANNVEKTIKKGELGQSGTTRFFDTSTPCLVVQANGRTHAVLDDICIVPAARVSMWQGWNEQREPRQRSWNMLSEELVTPHTSWAKPYAGGTLKVLSLMGRKKHRLTVELAQRLSMQYYPVFFEFQGGNQNSPFELGRDYWVYDRDGDPELLEKEKDTMARLSQPTDCIVIADINASAVLPAMTNKILEKVSAGTGLVIIGQKDFEKALWSKAVNNENRTSQDAGWVITGATPVKNVSFYQYGKGRIACLFTERMDTLKDDRASLEDNLSFMIKAMLWASNKLPDIKIHDFQLPEQKISGDLRAQVKRDSLPCRITVSAKSTSSKPSKASITGWIDNYDDFKSIPLGTVKLDGDSNASFEIPKLAAGRSRIHFQIKNGNAVEDFNTVVLNVTSTECIENIELDQRNRLFTAGDFINGRVVLKTPLKAGQKVRIQLIDADGRIWAGEEKVSTGKAVGFSLKTDTAPILIHRILAEVIDAAGLPVDAREAECAVVRPAKWYNTFFDYQIWVLPDTFLGCRELRKYGVSSSYHEGIFRNYALNNIRGAPGLWISDWDVKLVGDKKHAPERAPCLNDPKFRAKMAAAADTLGSKAAPLGALGYSIAHEWCARGYGRLQGQADFCFCPQCLNSFRQFAREQYETVAGVNAEWGTAFKNWEEVTPLVLNDALESGQIPRWIDHRRHADRALACFLRFLMDSLRKNHPDANGILSGMRSTLATFDSYNGVDHWGIYNDAKMSGYLDGDTSLYIDAFIPQESGRRHLVSVNQAMWHPHTKTTNDDFQRLRLGKRPWNNLLTGSHGFTFYEEYAFMPPYGYVDQILNADLTVGVIEPANKSVAQIRKGIAHFVFESEQNNSGIAIFYSRSSEHVATAWQELNKANNAAAEINPSAQRDFYVKALRANGYQCNMISDAQISNGYLQSKGYRLLILPFTQAISAQATEQIRDFVKAGGKILADIRPGMTDLAGKPGDAGRLDKVFGVRHETGYNIYKPKKDEIKINGKIGKTSLEAVVKDAFCGSVLQIDGAEVYGKGRNSKLPAFLVNSFGRGEAILMNCVISNPDDKALKMMGDLIAGLGLRPLFGVEAQKKTAATAKALLTEADKNVNTKSMIAEAGFAGIAGIARPVLRDFINGGIHCFGFDYSVRRGMGSENLHIIPPVPGYIYNLKNNECLGWKESFDIAFQLEDLGFYASVPYKIQAPELTLTKSVSAGDLPTISCQAQLKPDAAAKERQVIQFTLFAPDGTEWKDFAATETAVNGKALCTFELPLNMPSGKWKVIAREAISGLSDSAEIFLSANK